MVLGRQDAGLDRDARAGLLLQDTLAEHVLHEKVGVEERDPRSPVERTDGDEVLVVDDELGPRADAVVEDGGGREDVAVVPLQVIVRGAMAGIILVPAAWEIFTAL